MLLTIGIILFIIGTGGYSYYRYRYNKNRSEVRNILHKYMVLDDEDLEQTGSDDDFKFNKFVDPNSNTDIDL